MYVIKAQSKCQKCTEEGNRTKETQNSDACKLSHPVEISMLMSPGRPRHGGRLQRAKPAGLAPNGQVPS